MFNRSRLNLAHWFALSMGSIFTLFTAGLYYLQADDQLNTFDENLYQKTKVAATKVQHQLEQGQWQVKLQQGTPRSGREASPQNELVYARWYDANGRLVQFTGLQPVPEQITLNNPVFQTIRVSVPTALAEGSLKELEERSLRQFTVPVKHNRVIIGYLQTATPLAPLEADLSRMLLMLTLGVPITLGAIGLTGWALGGMAMQPIRQSYDRLQRFTADASHELRTPLAAILSNVQVAMMPAFKAGEQASEQQQCLAEVEKAAKSMGGLLDNLLFLARHEAPMITATLNQKIDTLDVLYPLVNQYQNRALQQERTFTSHMPKQAIYIRADTQLLQRSIANLLDNAFKYTPSGGSIHLRCLTQSHHAVIQVEDNGVGIPEPDLPHIFDRFYRVDVARSRQTGGFGLGLSIAQQIVQAHGGHIKVSSVLGQGTRFQIEIPLGYGRSKVS
ncbi:MAG: HAMP domain-containing histidine kinase [Drouetiella hepatica Uher 2000/2452]|jgi:signal transduction histidine kinase|uniref:histidine kinase n=1 Tax=Drouetiella hepatica Uher 2000/2452 TaxID=904376 RepID=A0A951UL87_9CYAN|nr:HAMP domain-containing histidine kinase [Drouetiella hepatica Uher 2000/2452]